MSSVSNLFKPSGPPPNLPKPMIREKLAQIPPHPASIPSTTLKLEDLPIDVLQEIAKQFKQGNRKTDLVAVRCASRKMNEAAKRLFSKDIPIDVADLDRAQHLKTQKLKAARHAASAANRDPTRRVPFNARLNDL